VEFMDWLAERGCTPLAFDYHLDEQTVLMTESAPAGVAGTRQEYDRS
jgi:hypothetical protein